MKYETNHYMYVELKEKYDKEKSLSFEIINNVLMLSDRTSIDLKNLIEYIVAVTLLCGQDVLKAQLVGDREAEDLATQKHNKNCELMSILLEAIESELVSRQEGL